MARPAALGPARPPASTPEVRRRMQATKQKDTEPELALRRALHARGLRYRVNVKLPALPRRRMDIVFPSAKLVVLVHGCFWHSCPDHATTAKANYTYWLTKLKANRERDLDTERRLQEAGWTVLTVWEHEPVETAADRVAQHLAEAVSGRKGSGDAISDVGVATRRRG